MKNWLKPSNGIFLVGWWKSVLKMILGLGHLNWRYLCMRNLYEENQFCLRWSIWKVFEMMMRWNICMGIWGWCLGKSLWIKLHYYYWSPVAQFTLSEANVHSFTSCNSYHHFQSSLLLSMILSCLKVVSHREQQRRKQAATEEPRRVLCGSLWSTLRVKNFKFPGWHWHNAQ